MTVEWESPKMDMTPLSFETYHAPEAQYNGQTIPCRVVSWTDVTDGGMNLLDSEQDLFVAGHVYQAAVELQIPEGMTIPISDITSTTSGFLPGMTWEKEDHLIEVIFRFTIDDEYEDVGDVLSISVSDPAKGKTPEEIEKDGPTVLFNGKSVISFLSDWRIYDMKRSDEGSSMDAETPFEPGHYYSVAVIIDEPENYSGETTEIRCENEVQVEGTENGKLKIRLFFDQLAYQEISSEITIETADVRSGMTVAEMNQLLKVRMGEVEVGDTEYRWSTRRNGEETVLEDTDLLIAEAQTAYALDVRFVLPPSIRNDEFTLQVSGSGYHYHTGLMTSSGNNRTYGRVRIVYESEDLLPSKEKMSEADILVRIPSWNGEEELSAFEKEIHVSALNRSVNDFSADWGAYVDNHLYTLNEKTDHLNGLLTLVEGDQKVEQRVDYYLLTLNFPMIRIQADKVKLAVDSEGVKTSWVSFWEDESGKEMAQVMILIDPSRVIHTQKPFKGIEHIFLYVPELYPGMTLEEINSHLLLMIGGSAYTSQEIRWTQGTDEEGNPIILSPEEMLHWDDEKESPVLTVRISSGNVNQESIRQLKADLFGIDPEESPYELTLDSVARKVDLTIRNLECSKPFIRITSPIAYSGSPVSFDPSAYQVLWIDEYQTVELKPTEIGWRVSDEIFDPDTADAEGEETVWEGENFEFGRHYAADLFAVLPENRIGTDLVRIFSAPYLSLMSSASVVRQQEDGTEILCAHLAVEPSYHNSESCIEHSFVVNEEESIEATCTAEGLRVSYCEICGAKLEEVLPMIDHDAVYDEAASHAADCSREGLRVYTCSQCGLRWEETEPKLEHEMWISDAQSRPATCQTEGTQVLICAKCGYRTSNSLPKTRHTYHAGERVEPGCESMGTQAYVCSVCGDRYVEYIPARGHQYVQDEAQSTPATCSQEGTAVMVCSVCGHRGSDRTIPKTEHSYVKDEAQSRPATCAQEGKDVLVCSICGDTIENTIPVTEHDYEEITLYPSTCYAEGAATKRCRVCGHEADVVIPLPMKEHVMVQGEGTAPTCTQEGTSVRYCSNEGCSYREETSIPRIPHQYEGGHCIMCYEPDPSYSESVEEMSEYSWSNGESVDRESDHKKTRFSMKVSGLNQVGK